MGNLRNTRKKKMNIKTDQIINLKEIDNGSWYKQNEEEAVAEYPPCPEEVEELGHSASFRKIAPHLDFAEEISENDTWPGGSEEHLPPLPFIRRTAVWHVSLSVSELDCPPQTQNMSVRLSFE